MKTPLKIWRLVFVCSMILCIISDVQDEAFSRARFLISFLMFGGMIYLNCIIQSGIVRIHAPCVSRQKCRAAYEEIQTWLREQTGDIYWKDAPIETFKTALEEHLNAYPDDRYLGEVRRWQALYKWLDSEVGPMKRSFFGQ